jgi:hypothetical protein
LECVVGVRVVPQHAGAGVPDGVGVPTDEQFKCSRVARECVAAEEFRVRDCVAGGRCGGGEEAEQAARHGDIRAGDEDRHPY